MTSPKLEKMLANRRTEEEARLGVTPGKLGCDYCGDEPEPGYIETLNNGPIVPCPVCNKEDSDARR